VGASRLWVGASRSWFRVMIAEERRSRKQHLLSALSHVSRWERNRGEAQQISSEIPSFKTFTFFTKRGLFLILLSEDEKQHLHSFCSWLPNQFPSSPTISFSCIFLFLIHFHLNHWPVQKYKTKTQEKPTTHRKIPSIHILTFTSDSFSIPIPSILVQSRNIPIRRTPP